MKKFLAIALLVLSCNIAFAQNKVTGKVTSSEDGSPIPFASVVIKGTMTGEATDDNGAFTLTNVPANAVLEISSIGFLTQTVQVNGKSVINVSLSPDSEALDEVMVVAYGTVKKGSYSGSAAVVKQDAIKDAPVVRTSRAALLPTLLLPFRVRLLAFRLHPTQVSLVPKHRFPSVVSVPSMPATSLFTLSTEFLQQVVTTLQVTSLQVQ